MTSTKTAANDEILGYKIESRIGEGGFGEVWRATAPGGLSKAVKLVFGYHDESRAQSELKALNKVKGIRHPFLLSLERIDIVNGQLVVVTELADCSLKERFKECVTQGTDGIPRDELLGYICDAADGLDYLCDKHLLQHLDVKPENLLLMGGHVKVADYGLVKDVRNNDQSVMRGLTPTYAAPELFDGRPSQLSDQYSLAIVYQEMLTGVRPFAGTTPAQLARQHMLGRPNLDSLPRGDQSVVAKALSKDPANRFESCTEFYEELAKRKNSGPTKQRRTDGIEDQTDSVPHDETMVISADNLPTSHDSVQAERLPPLDCDGAQTAFHPTLLIGVGRTGSWALQCIKEKLFQRFGRTDELAALKMLCLDTDIHDLAHITNSDERLRFRDEEVLPIPLKTSDEYRKTGDKYSRWLSRRWIFNVPRSFSTEGIRPLGRLAFADHSEKIFDRLHQSIQGMVDQEVLEESAAAVNMPVNPTPRVYIVGSISGGVGSGMIADLAYAVRTVLQEHGLSDQRLIGILLHGSKTHEESALATANTYAFLREICHYAKLGYPGDSSIGLPAFDDVDPPAFSDLYLQHCGPDGYDNHARSVADYIYLDVVTSCNDFFKRCRTGRDENGNIGLRTVGISRVEMQQEKTRARFAAFLRERLFVQWLHDEDYVKETFDVEAFTTERLKQADVSEEKILATGLTLVEAFHGPHLSEQLLEIARAVAQELPPEEKVAGVIAAMNRHLKGQDADSNAKARATDLVNKEITQITPALWEPISSLIDESNVRLAGARHAYRLCEDCFTSIRESVTADLFEVHAAIQSKTIGDEAEDETYARLSTMRAKKEELEWSLRLLGAVHASSVGLREQFEAVDDLLESARAYASDDNLDRLDETPDDSYGRTISGFLNNHVAIFVTNLETHIEDILFSGLGGLRNVAENCVSNAGHLANAVQRESRRLVAESFYGLNFDAVLDAAEPSETALEELVKNTLSSCMPRLMDCGGVVRLLLAMPPATPGSRFIDHAKKLFSEPTVVRGTDGDVAFCFEGENVVVEKVALRLLEETPDATEYIERIASRLDVEWRPLTGLG